MDGGTSGFETDWNTASNWSCGVPTATTDVTIPAGRTYYPVIGAANGICRTITDIGGGSISGNGTLTIAGNAGIAISNVSGTAIISCPVVMPATASLTVAGALTISGVISGAATSLTKAGAGTLTLLHTNTYDGSTIVNLGNLNIQDGSALGTATGGTTVNSGYLEILGGITVSTEPLTLTGNGVLLNISGNNFWGGPITISGTTTGIYSNGNTLTITNTINLNANQLTIQGAATTVVSGIISNTGSIHKAGGGSLTLSGANTFTGGVDLNNGQLNINSTSALGTGSLRITEGNNGNILKIDNTSATNQTVTNTVYWNDPFLFTGTKPLTFSGSVILGSGPSGTRSVTVSSATNFLTIGSLISDGGNGLGFTKLGSGTLVLLGSGTYTGATILTAGELRLNPAVNSTTASQFVLNGGTLSTSTISTGRTFTSSSTLQLNDNSILNLGGNTHTLTFANSSSIAWTTGKILTINGWTGPPGGSGTAGRIFIGSSTGTLTSSQLAEIKFAGYTGIPILLPNGELVPAAAAVLAITGTPTNLGSLCIGTPSTPVTYTITNTNATATGVTVTSNNSQFVVSSLSSTTIIGDGGTATFVVTFTPTISGSQSATITVTSDISNSPTITLTGTGLAIPTIIGTLNVCVSSTTQLTGSGTPALTNPWISGLTGVAAVSNTGLVTGVSAGTSLITYTDSNGCIKTATVTVDALPATLVLSGSTICTTPGGNGTITSTNSVTGVHYQLYNSSNSAVQASQAGTSSALTWSSLPAGTGYYVIATDDAHSCVSPNSNTANVSTNANPTITGTLTVCAGSTTQLSGSGTPAVASPWVSSSTGVATVYNSGLVTGVSVGTSVITYTDINGCASTSTVTVNTLPVISTIPDQTDCKGNNVDFTTTYTAGGAVNYQWQSSTDGGLNWSNITGASGSSSSSPITLSLSNIGVSGLNVNQTQYRLVITDGNGCSATSNSAILTVNSITAITGSPTTTLCEGQSISFTATTEGAIPNSYQWIKHTSPGNWSDVPGAITQTISFTNISIAEAGEYSVRAIFPITIPNNNNSTTCTETNYNITRTLIVNPLSTATPGGPDSICQSATPSSMALSGASVGGSATTGAWSITNLTPANGGAIGTLSSTAQTSSPGTVTYTPPANYVGIVTLTLTTDDPTGPCGGTSATRTITINPLPITSPIYHR